MSEPTVALVVPCVPIDIENLLTMLQQLADGTDWPDEIIVALSDAERAPIAQLTQLKEWLAQCRAPQTRLLCRTEQVFAGDNRNCAIAAAKSDIIVCHDADDAIHPQKIALIRHWFAKRPDVMLLLHWLQPYGYEWRWCDNYDTVPIADVDEMRDVDFDTYRKPIQRGHAAFRRSPVAEHVQFPSNYAFGEDLRFLIDAHALFHYTLVLEWPLCKYDDLTSMPPLLRERWSDWVPKSEPNGLLSDRVKCGWQERADQAESGQPVCLLRRDADGNDDDAQQSNATSGDQEHDREHEKDASIDGNAPVWNKEWPPLTYVDNGRYLLPYEGHDFRRYALDVQWFDRAMSLPIGVTFMIRAKNEQNKIVDCILTLRDAFDYCEPQLAYNIVLVDNGSTDDTLKRALPLLRPDRGDLCVSYALQVSKPGIESYVTPCNSAHSLPWFYQWCVQRCEQYSHVFKWDADFRMSEPLANALRVHFASRYRLPADLYSIMAVGNDGRTHRECYCIALRLRYRYILMRLWETWQTFCSLPTESLDDSECILHASSLDDAPKRHLLYEPWWEQATSQESWVAYVKSQYRYWKRRLPRGAATYTRATDNSCRLLEQTLPYRELSIEGLPVP